MKKIIAIAIAAAVLGMGATSFADLGSSMQNAATKATDKAADKATDKATDKAVDTATKKVAGDQKPAAEPTKTAKKSKVKGTKKAE